MKKNLLQKASGEDKAVIMEIISDAKKRMKQMGLDQWQDGYPDEAVIEKDIQSGSSYFYLEDGEPAAVFAFFLEEDPTYAVIEEGDWLTEGPYSVIHRIAVAEGKTGQGVMGKVMELAGQRSLEAGRGSIRIDTHPDNKSMQRALEKSGFSYCGHIYLENGDLRLAYEKILEKIFQ